MSRYVYLAVLVFFVLFFTCVFFQVKEVRGDFVVLTYGFCASAFGSLLTLFQVFARRIEIDQNIKHQDVNMATDTEKH
jgi:hypothetical protein